MIEHLGKFFFFSLKLRTFSPPKNSQSKLKLACFKHEKMHDFVLGLNPFVTRTYPNPYTASFFFFFIDKNFYITIQVQDLFYLSAIGEKF